MSFAAETFNRSNPKNEAYIYVSQITGFNEAKINKIVSAQQEMILNFDFVVQKGIVFQKLLFKRFSHNA